MVQEKKHLNVSFEKQSFHEDDKFYFFSGYASTFGNIDLGGDIVMPGAFVESLESKLPKLLYQHQMICPLGIITRAHEDPRGLFVEGKMPKANSMCTDVASLIECGAIDSFSIGYSINKDGHEFDENGNQLLKSLDLMEVSFVTIPMNGQATINDFKAVGANDKLPFASRDMEWDSTAAIDRVREFSDSVESPSDTYKTFFLFFDEANEENFAAYKLPIVDIVDGKPRIVPRAVFAVAGALSGARGGVDIPVDDREKIINVVNDLYGRMRNEFNDPTLISPFQKSIEGLKSIRDVELLLKERGSFSQKERKGIISKIKEFSNHRDDDSQEVLKAKRDAEVANEKEAIVNCLKNINSQLTQIL